MATKFYPAPPEVRKIYLNPIINEYRNDLAQAKIVLLFREGKWAAKDKTTWAQISKVTPAAKAMLQEAATGTIPREVFKDDEGFLSVPALEDIQGAMDVIDEEFTPTADLLIVINAEIWRHFNYEQRTALLHHELCHVTTDYDKYGDLKYIIVTHDLEEFNQIVRLYGNWSEDCKLMFEAMNKGGQQVIDFSAAVGSVVEEDEDEEEKAAV